ncbi:MAG: tetratricopeptide repeat protein [Thermoanaerobaculia bacterium]|nr:tetratricopeptide repeat protein [Thermoanaerobaculia bacterium]
MSLALAMSACGTWDIGHMTPAEIAYTLEARGVDAEQVVLPYWLSPEMRDWARKSAPRGVRDIEKLYRLRDHLLDKDQMSLEYSWGYTGTAVEAFRERRANCLAFTYLFVGMAREVGVRVHFLAVDKVESYRRRGDLVVVSDHIAVGFGDAGQRKIFDFSQGPEDDLRFVRKISDLAAIAMFHSNKGAEALQMGKQDEAVRWLRLAVGIDPGLASAWVNLGVALRRGGQLEDAEMAYKRALESDPSLHSAYQNLASLLRSEGRIDEAIAYEQALAETPTRNPYTFLSLGDISLASGRLADAERFYRRAVQLNDNDPEVFAALGQLAIANGKDRLAHRMLKRARKSVPAAWSQRSGRLERLENALRFDG